MTPLLAGAPQAVIREFSQQRAQRGRYVSSSAAAATAGRSVRFNSADSAYLSRANSSTATSQRKFTLSFWLKQSRLSNEYVFCTPPGTNADVFRLQSDGTARFYLGGTTKADFETSRRFRDPGAWYHFVFAIDTTQSTTTERVKIYVNGIQLTAAEFSTATYPTQNTDLSWTQNGVTAYFGQEGNNSNYASIMLADAYLIDGQQLAPTSFGESNATTGAWNPVAYSGAYGNNGWHLDFADNSAATASTLGKDTSGKGNNWTPNNLSVTAGSGNDSLRDHPTSAGTSTGAGGEVAGNYATLNPLTMTGSVKTYSNGNLEVTATSNNNVPSVVSTFGAGSGKWYAEVVAGWSSSGIGFINAESVKDSIESSYGLGTPVDGWTRYGTYIFNNGILSSGLTSVATNDLLQLALDLDNGKAWFGINGTWENSGNPANGTNPSVTFTPGGKTFLIGSCFRRDGTAVTMIHNYGARAFAYSVPSGFSPLVDTLLPTPTIGIGNTVMDVKLYTGNGSTQTISGLNFSPDLVWIKERSGTRIHALCDSVRGDGLLLYSNSTLAEQDIGSTVVDLTSDGFNLGFNSGYTAVSHNWNSITHVAWAWDAGSSNATNTSGTITSTVRANTTAGFSVVTVNSTTAGTAGHGLGVKPAMIIEKCRGAASNWYVRHKSLTNMAAYYLSLNSTSSAASDGSAFNNSEPTSTTFGVNNGYLYANGSVVYYCFAEVAGYSAFGSYTGNGSTDGPFVYTGFRPKYVLLKCSSAGDSAKDWFVHDGVRDTYNLAQKSLNPNRDITELDNSSYGIDILSNGFKIRTTSTGWNGSGSTYVYACFAEAPFPYARAR